MSENTLLPEQEPSMFGQPLAARMRPASLDEIAGQQHLLGPGKVLRRLIASDSISSMIFWGPPGVGKTTLARVIALQTKATFIDFSAVTSGIKEIRQVMLKAEENRAYGMRTIVFVDEIHRFNKAQQDAFLPFVEKGSIVLIGATTENPSFEVITPLLSRCQVFVLKSLEKDDLQTLLDRALKEDVLLKDKEIQVVETDALMRYSGGDARKLLNVLEIVVDAFGARSPIVIDNKSVTESIQENMAIYDKDGEMHYDIISAFIKSIRGSDPNAALYYLARMIEGGEDPLFIARRLCLSASEDVGLANPNALLLANACFEVVSKIGMPEGRIPLAETTVYLASSPKSNGSYMALEKALALVRETGDLPVPLPIRNAPTQLMKDLNYSDGYKYAHDYPGHFADMEFLPDAIQGTVFYEPQPNKHENVLRAYLEACWPKYYGKH